MRHLCDSYDDTTKKVALDAVLRIYFDFINLLIDIIRIVADSELFNNCELILYDSLFLMYNLQIKSYNQKKMNNKTDIFIDDIDDDEFDDIADYFDDLFSQEIDYDN